MDAVDRLLDVLARSSDRIARRWAKHLRADLFELEVSSRDVREPLEELLRDLARHLRERGEDGIELWVEAMRVHALHRFEHRFEAGDLAREIKWLQVSLLDEAADADGRVEGDLARLIAELAGEAAAGMHEA